MDKYINDICPEPTGTGRTVNKKGPRISQLWRRLKSMWN